MTSRLAPPCDLRAATKRVLLVLSAVWVLAQSARAWAQPAQAFELEWSAPQGCPGAAEVRERVRKLAGTTPTAGASLHADATVSRQADGGLHLHLLVRADNLVGERNIEGRSCSDLAGATAVALALLLRSPSPLTAADLTGAASDTGEPQQPSRSTATPPVVAQSGSPVVAPSGSASAADPAAPGPASASSDAPRKPRGWRALLQAPTLLVGVGPLHRASYGLALGAGMSVRRWLWVAEGRAWLPQRTSRAVAGQDYSADVQRYAAGLRGCHAFLWPRFQLAPCVALSVEHMSARGRGAHVAPSDAKTTWFAAGLGVQARVPLVRWLALAAGGELQIQTSRPQIAIDDVGVIEQLLPVAGVFTLALEWIL